jgi:hypothetical protein
MVRKPALQLMLAARLLLLLPPLQSPDSRCSGGCGLSGPDLICVLCTALKTLQCKKLPERDSKRQQYGSPERNNVNIVCNVACDVAYDRIVTTYDVKSRIDRQTNSFIDCSM